MDWEKLLCSERPGDSRYEQKPNRSIIVQDHDSIVFSSPFRSLLDQTLNEHDHTQVYSNAVNHIVA